MENEQIEVMQNFLPLLRPLEMAVFGPLFPLGILKELPSETIIRSIEPPKKREVVKEVREPEEAQLRVSTRYKPERKKIFGMWAGGF